MGVFSADKLLSSIALAESDVSSRAGTMRIGSSCGGACRAASPIRNANMVKQSSVLGGVPRPVWDSREPKQAPWASLSKVDENENVTKHK